MPRCLKKFEILGSDKSFDQLTRHPGDRHDDTTFLEDFGNDRPVITEYSGDDGWLVVGERFDLRQVARHVKISGQGSKDSEQNQHDAGR